MKRSKVSGIRQHPFYDKWASIKGRCFNPDNKDYHHYGGRGITMAEEWVEDSAAFCHWVVENLGACPDGMTLDRENNDGNYEPGNLRWAPWETQRGNRRDERLRAVPVGCSGFRWVRFVPRSGKWEGSFTKSGIFYNAGHYETPEQAHHEVSLMRQNMGLPC